MRCRDDQVWTLSKNSSCKESKLNNCATPWTIMDTQEPFLSIDETLRCTFFRMGCIAWRVHLIRHRAPHSANPTQRLSMSQRRSLLWLHNRFWTSFNMWPRGTGFYCPGRLFAPHAIVRNLVHLAVDKCNFSISPKIRAWRSSLLLMLSWTCRAK